MSPEQWDRSKADTSPLKRINPFFGFHFRGEQVNLAVDVKIVAPAVQTVQLLGPVLVTGDSWDYFSKNLTKVEELRKLFIVEANATNMGSWRLRVTAQVLTGGHIYLDNFGTSGFLLLTIMWNTIQPGPVCHCTSYMRIQLTLCCLD